MPGSVHVPRLDPVSGTEHRSPFDVVVVAASMGGPPVVRTVLAGLPVDFPAAVLVVQHRTPALDTRYTAALRTRVALPVRAGETGQPVGPPGITVLPARHTATVESGRLHLREQTDFRLADPLVTSVAEAFGPRALCVVLTGRLDDCAAGVRALKRHGGRTIAQDPATADAPDMPQAALATGCVDLVMPAPHIAAALVALTMAPGAAHLFRVPPSPWASLVA